MFRFSKSHLGKDKSPNGHKRDAVWGCSHGGAALLKKQCTVHGSRSSFHSSSMREAQQSRSSLSQDYVQTWFVAAITASLVFSSGLNYDP